GRGWVPRAAPRACLAGGGAPRRGRAAAHRVGRVPRRRPGRAGQGGGGAEGRRRPQRPRPGALARPRLVLPGPRPPLTLSPAPFPPMPAAPPRASPCAECARGAGTVPSSHGHRPVTGRRPGSGRLSGMRKRIPLMFAALLGAASVAAAPPATADGAPAIATYNAFIMSKNLYPNWGQDLRADMIAEDGLLSGQDVVVLQEAFDNSASERLIGNLSAE